MAHSPTAKGRAGATKIEESQWILKNTAAAIDVAKDLLRFMDGNDRLLVAQVGADYAWFNLMVSKESAQKLLAA